MSEKPPSGPRAPASHGRAFLGRPDLFAQPEADVDGMHPPLQAVPPELGRVIHFGDRREKPSRHEQQEIRFTAEHMVIPARYRSGPGYRSECQDDGFHDERTGTIAACDGVGSGGASQLAARAVTRALREYTRPGHPDIPFFSSTLDQRYSDEEARRAARTLHGKLHAEVFKLRSQPEVRRICEERLRAENPFFDPTIEAFQKQLVESIKNSGTTLALVRPFRDSTGRLKVVCLNVGDSRIYRRRQGQFEQVSRDHGYIQALAELGLVRSEFDDQTFFSEEQVTAVLDRVEAELSSLPDTDPVYRVKESQAHALTILLKEFAHRKAADLTLDDVGNVCLGWIGYDIQPDLADIWIDEAFPGDEYYTMTDQLYENLDTKTMEKARHRVGDVAAATRVLCALAGTIGKKDDDGTVSGVAITRIQPEQSGAGGIDPDLHQVL